VELRDELLPAHESGDSRISPNARRMLEAIERLPDEEREVFDLLRIQGLTQPEAAELLGVSVRTVQRRLGSSILMLSDVLADLCPAELSAEAPDPDAS
jgi:RNA polymerase sigma-70 factor (ECF subfamily)